jgi:hypothetical protein
MWLLMLLLLPRKKKTMMLSSNLALQPHWWKSNRNLPLDLSSAHVKKC